MGREGASGLAVTSGQASTDGVRGRRTFTAVGVVSGPIKPSPTLMYYVTYYKVGTVTEVDVVVRKAGNSIDLRVPRRVARRLGLAHGRRLRVRIEEVPDAAELVGTLKGRVSAAKLHAATNEDEDLG